MRTRTLTDIERVEHRAASLKKNMKNYLDKNRAAHNKKCGNVIKDRYKNDPEYRKAYIEKAKKYYSLKKEFKIFCKIEYF